jgi:hypothetical protein
MKTKTYLSVIVATIALAVIPAIGFEYDEAVQGDIDNHGNNGTLPLFHLNIGTNVISGTMTLGSVSDSDAFRFQIPPGATLDPNSITYAYQVTDVDRVLAFGVRLQIAGPAANTQTFATATPEQSSVYLFSDGTVPGTEVTTSPAPLQFYQVIDSSVDLNFPASPLAPGTYSFNTGLHWFSDFPDGSATWNYTITVVVNPSR